MRIGTHGLMHRLARANTKSYSIILAFLLLYILINSQIFAEEKFSFEGKEFWVCFTQNYKDGTSLQFDTTHILRLYMIGSDSSDVHIYNPLYKLDKKIKLQRQKPEIFDVRKEFECGTPYQTVMNGIYLKSSSDIRVYALNSRYQTSDAYAVLPLSSLGYEYYTASMPNTKSFLSNATVLATEDSTRVTIIPKVVLSNGLLPGFPLYVTLNKGASYTVQARFEPMAPEWGNRIDDITGSYIKADKKIAVFSGHECSNIPIDKFACNYLVEQMQPVNMLGKEFIVTRLPKRTKTTFRVLAIEDKTDIYINSKWIDILPAGHFYESDELTEDTYITASNPVLVMHYTHGYQDADSIGDPMMMLIPAKEQYKKSYIVTTPGSRNWEHYLIVTAPKEAIKSLSIDGKIIEANKFRRVAYTDYNVLHIKIEYGSHVLKSDQPFGVNIYGYSTEEGIYDAYGTM